MNQRLVNVAVPDTGGRLFTYRLPERNHVAIEPGQRCIVPFGKRDLLGFIIETTTRPPKARLKTIHEILDPKSLFDAEHFGFLKWVSEYYVAGIADCLRAALPPGLRKMKAPGFLLSERLKNSLDNHKLPEKQAKSYAGKQKLTSADINFLKKEYPDIFREWLDNDLIIPDWQSIRTTTESVLLGYTLNPDTDRKNLDPSIVQLFESGDYHTAGEIKEAGVSDYRLRKIISEKTLLPRYGLPPLFDYIRPRENIADIKPNNEQQTAIDTITANMKGYHPYLLFGITGSGKTLVYCHVVREVLNCGRSALILVPEIALAGTLLSYFRSFFAEEIALLHSGLTDRERTLIWHNIKSGHFRIVIGARSALLAPLKDPGLIIIDEEHDEAYKQDDPAPRFQARDAAVMKARMVDIPVILGSASPAVESMYNAHNDRYELLKLTRRPEKAEVPLVRLIDLKEEPPIDYKHPFFTKTMIDKINRTLEQKHQVILYLNRRGFSPRIKCTDCGYTPECPHCQISLSYHRAGNRLLCHYCGYIDTGYNRCRQCDGDNFVYLGTGTQKIEEHLHEHAPDARIVRLDSDTARARKKAHLILSDFAAGKHNVLLGTQMVSKGIDFPEVALVGILLADIGIDMPDFRAEEKLFAKLLQVSGRSGRGIIPGEVIIQTFNPFSDLIDDAARQDYETFYNRAVESRKKLAYPPFAHLVNLRLAAKKEADCEKFSIELKRSLEERLKKGGIKYHLLGPAPCPLYRLRGMYRRQLLIKTGQITKMTSLFRSWLDESPNLGLPSRIKLIIDIDPYDMM